MHLYFSRIRNLYWSLRAVRGYDLAARRRYYRLIAVEKKRLQEAGVDPEEIRLFCRACSMPDCPHAERRYRAYVLQLRGHAGTPSRSA